MDTQLAVGHCVRCDKTIDTALWSGLCKGCFDLVWHDPHPTTVMKAVLG